MIKFSENLQHCGILKQDKFRSIEKLKIFKFYSKKSLFLKLVERYSLVSYCFSDIFLISLLICDIFNTNTVIVTKVYKEKANEMTSYCAK